MLRWLIALALLDLGASSVPMPDARWPVQRYVKWQPEWGSRTITVLGLDARIEVERCGEQAPVSEGCSEGSFYLVATVATRGMAPVRVRGAPGLGAFVGIGKLTADAALPSLILISDRGGSGGCVEIDVAAPQQGAYRSARFGITDNSDGSLCAIDPTTLAWPRDLTRHGRAEFQVPDAAFHCRFSSCAGSWYPPRFIAFDGRRSIDVSADPALAPFYRADMAKARYACEHQESEAQAACAAYAADASRLGLSAQAWRVIDAQVRRGCRIKVSGACSYGMQVSAKYKTDLAAALPKMGYR